MTSAPLSSSALPSARRVPHPRPAVDGKALRDACSAFATGVTVITAATGVPGHAEGTTVNSFTSVSLDPPLVLFCLHRQSRLGPVLRRSGGFVVNFLAHHQQELAWAFAGRDSARVEEVPHRRTAEGLPLLAGALGHLVCRLDAEYDGGDHLIVVGEVVELGVPEPESAPGAAPLVFYRGAMHALPGTGSPENPEQNQRDF
ncbi:flavin reductase family protein [Actinacidiphila guanduensis]|uniref:NADH-FMN oxidoreductase RutF, flavin reductase (DIM6/NTAB) family n=1 Tax=Actinacidiphila guanduensis TaxID=310781 RepID=A0A1H0H0H6_9ACTN|nr:flavin reductase family protein [Actinacidiphila guanduensis]SDO12562.1 NADH-FMN oxidoreductase RutF, flavin reductase (DIM6/NTAB) family [Actinacidiphila guanduensis]